MRTAFYPRNTKHLLALFICAIIGTSSFAQMWNGQDSLYGNEWLNNSQDYYKIEVSENGIYRIPQSVLAAAGFPVGTQPSIGFQLYAYGEEVPMYASTSGILGGNDYLEFYGEKHTTQMDQYLFTKESDMLNPAYSVITDRTNYYLTLNPGSTGLRYENVQNDLSNTGPAQTSYLHEELKFFTEQHVKFSFGQGVKYSHFDQGEGFGSGYAQSRTVSVLTSAIANNGGQSKLKVRFNTSKNPHDLNLSFLGTSLLTESFTGFQLRNHEFDITTSTLTADNKLVLEGTFDENDRYSLASVELVYPREFNFNNQESFSFKLASADRQYLEIENFKEGSGSPVLYDLTNNTRIVTNYASANDLVQVLIPSGAGNRQLFLSNNEEGVKQVESLQKYNPRNFESISGNYLIISHSALLGAGGAANYVEEYAQYRASAAGGGFDVEIINIDEIENQFGYGSPKHPQAMRNFAHWIAKNWEDPQYIFIIGKGIEYSKVRTDTDLANPQNSGFYIPTWGSPGSDNLLLSNDATSVPVIPMGRLAVVNPEQLNIYLEKVKLQESSLQNPQTIEDRYWMKQVLHLSGGSVQGNEQAQIANGLSTMETVLGDNLFGADVTTFYKTSTDPVQISESDAIFDLINDGVSIISFFGHSSVGTFDFSIDNPQNYENFGKYPLIISLGCYSGNIHTNGEGISERFVFYEDKGALAFMASVGQAYVSPLSNLGADFYKNLGGENYGDGVGVVLQSTLRNISVNTSFPNRTLVQQMTLNGDPALRIYNDHPGTDYVVDESTVKFSPAVVDTRLDDFEIIFDLVNIGSYSSEAFKIEIYQEYPNGDRNLIKIVESEGIRNTKEFKVVLPGSGSISGGLNKFYINVDSENVIAELPDPFAENNNGILSNSGKDFVELFIYNDNANPIFPCEYGIQNSTDFSLFAATSFVPDRSRQYLFEIDTTPNFNSSLLQATTLTSAGGLLEWKPNMIYNDGTVYFWRVSPDITSQNNEYAWQVSSFLYQSDLGKGWNQSTHHQLKSGQFTNIEYGSNNKLKFFDDFLDIRIKNKIPEPENSPEFQFNGNNFTEMFEPMPYATLRVAVVDDKGKFWKTNVAGGPFEVENPLNGAPPLLTFIWRTGTTEERANIIDFLQNTIPDDHTVFVYTNIVNVAAGSNLFTDEWAADSLSLGQNLFSVLEGFGATRIRDMESLGGLPYTFIFKKGQGFIGENLAVLLSETIFSETAVPGLWDNGSIKSTFIGPASAWESFDFELEDFDNFVNDKISFTIYGSENGNSAAMVLKDSIINLQTDLSFIDAEVYPYIRVEFHSEDKADKSTPNIKHLRVQYEGVPEYTFDPGALYSLNRDTMDQGEELKIEFAIKNIGEAYADSSAVKVTFKDNNNQETIKSSKIPPLGNNESTTADFTFNTNETKGLLNIIVEANADKTFIEKYNSNNFLLSQSFIEEDKTNPILDVTFNGIHIMNGDLVSANSEIVISLRDENAYFPLNDTSNMKIVLSDPDDVTTDIKFSDPGVEFTPGDESSNHAVVRINRFFEQDGDYELIVQAEDRNGNSSGRFDYKVNFKIVNERMISNVLNYPNPFSTSTKFVYTLTGDQAPDFFKIQIFTVSGRIIRELTQDELGPLKVGTHRTEGGWDGRDDFGDRLGNGIYLYRVVTKESNGNDYKSFINNSVDSFFTEGFGKMVLMR